MTEQEFGVLWKHQSGRTWVAGGYTQTGALRAVENVADWPAYDAEAVVRTVGDWLPLVAAVPLPKDAP